MFVGVPLVLPALIGALHLPIARPLLGALGMGCPLKASPEEVEAARLRSARAVRGTEPSPARPALGFRLDQMTRAEVEAWASQSGLSCQPSQQGMVLRCKAVPATALGEAEGMVDDLTFGFRPQDGRLVNLTALRAQPDPGAAAETLQRIRAGLAAKLGEGRLLGQPTALYLAGGALRTALVEYRFRDYLADVSATNLGDRVVVREHYMSALD